MWDLLLELGYEADGLYIGLGIGDYSEASATYARDFAAERGLQLIEVVAARRVRLRRAHRGAGHPPGAVLVVRAEQAPPVRQGGARRRLRRGRHRPQPRRRGRGAVRQHPALGDRVPRPPAARAAGAPRLPAQGQAARAPHRAGDRGVVRGARHRLPRRGVPDGRGQQAPRLQGGAERHRARVARAARPRSTSTSSSGWRRCWPACAPRRRPTVGTCASVRRADERRRLRVLPAGRHRVGARPGARRDGRRQGRGRR